MQPPVAEPATDPRQLLQSRAQHEIVLPDRLVSRMVIRQQPITRHARRSLIP